MKVMIVVTHLLGTGHLMRAVTLARAFGDQGHGATVISGGMGVAHLDLSGVALEQLPPLRSDGAQFTRLLDDAGQMADDTYLTARRDQLCAHYARLKPDVVITELFPFGRRVLSDEFLALLAQVDRARTTVLASVRDILAPPSKPAKAMRAEEIIATHYDGVLVHSDPAITRLDQSWPVSPALSQKLLYTGFVAPPPAAPDPDLPGQSEVLVSAGGGDVGADLFHIAARAARLDPDRRWRLLPGGGLTLDLGDSPAILDHARPEFRAMLHHAAASVSLCGYNTALDLLGAGTPAVLVPFDAGGEVEQTLRARALAQLPGFAMLEAARLTPERLLQAVDRVAHVQRRQQGQLDGSAQTVRLTEELWSKR